MIKVFFLIFEPGVGWTKIAQARRGFAFIFITYLLPFLLLVTGLEGWSLEKWGKWQPKFQQINHFPPHTVYAYEGIQFFLLLGMVLISALLVLRICQTFHGRNSYLQAFTLTAYAFSPIFLLRLLDVSPSMNPWATWVVGIGLTIWILYQGIPLVLQPDPTHAFGLYLSTIFVIVLTSGTVRLITGMFLLGQSSFQHSWLTHALGQ
jgi:hypothetical protein